jgi:molecular chaperone GrpE
LAPAVVGPALYGCPERGCTLPAQCGGNACSLTHVVDAHYHAPIAGGILMQAPENTQQPEKPAEQAEQSEQKTAVQPPLEEQLANAEAKVKEMQDAYLRAKAEVENVRRRAQEEINRTHKYAIESFAEAVVPVKDSLEMALQVETPSTESYKEGVEITLKQLSSAFEKNLLNEINPVRGEKLDPMKHQAISVTAADQEANTIVNVLQKGYMIGDRLLRPALVTVAQEKANKGPA